MQAHRTKDWAELADWGRQVQPEPEGGNRGPREASYTKAQADFVANQDFLGFWTVDICHPPGGSQPEISFPEEGATAVHPENRKAGTREGRSHSLQLGATMRAEDLVTQAAWTWDGQKRQAQPSLRLRGVPENLNPSGLDLGSACNPGPASDSSRQSNLEPGQCRLGKLTRRQRGKPSAAQTLWARPTHTGDICS